MELRHIQHHPRANNPYGSTGAAGGFINPSSSAPLSQRKEHSQQFNHSPSRTNSVNKYPPLSQQVYNQNTQRPIYTIPNRNIPLG